MSARNVRRLIASLFCIALLAGCAGPSRQDDSRAVVDLLSLYARVVAMPADDQQREYRAALAAMEQQPDDIHRLRLALLLAVPGTPWRDDARALRLIDGMDAVSSTGSVTGTTSVQLDLAIVIREFLRERQEIERRDQETIRRLQGQLADRQKQLREEHRQVEILQRKVDALLAIDRDMRRRSQHK